MKHMYAEAEINTENMHTVNHSSQVMCCTRFLNQGFEEQMISSRSGHRSNAVPLYKCTIVEQQNLLHCVSKKRPPFCFGNNSVKNWAIWIIFGTQHPVKI